MNEEDRLALWARLLITVRDCVVLLGTAATIVILYWLSHSWASLWAMLLPLCFSLYKNVPVKNVPREASAPGADEPQP